jgi:hypothetical protein
MRFAGVSDSHFGDPLSHSRLRRSIPVRGEAIILYPEYLPSATVCCARGTSSPLAAQSMLSGEALQGPRGQNELGRATPTPPSGNIYLGSSILLFPCSARRPWMGSLTRDPVHHTPPCAIIADHGSDCPSAVLACAAGSWMGSEYSRQRGWSVVVIREAI